MTAPQSSPSSDYQPHRIGLHSDDRPYAGEEMCYCDRPKPIKHDSVDEILTKVFILGANYVLNNPPVGMKQIDKVDGVTFPEAKQQILALIDEARKDEAKINYNSVIKAIQNGRDNPDLLWQDLAQPIADRIADLSKGSES